MSRYNFASIGVNGTTRQTNCDGTTSTTYQQAGVIITGSSKAPVVKSDGQLQTPYWAAWVTDNRPPTAEWKSSGISCVRIIGYTTKPFVNPITKTETVHAQRTWPVTTNFFPLSTMFLGAQAVVNTVPIETARFETIKRSMHNGLLNKVKDSKAMALVTLAETKKTVSLAKSLFDDVSNVLITVAKGITNPKSLVDKYRMFATKNGLRGIPKKMARNMTATERKFIRDMQKYYRKHPHLHQRLLNGLPMTAAERWLQYRYGIGPMLSDLGAMHDYVYTEWHEFVHKNDIVVKYRDRFNGTAVADTDNTAFGRITAKTDILAQFISRFYISNHTAMVARKTGFSPAELAVTVWELIPWSFVIDWFLNLGDWLSAASAIAGLTHRRTSFSIKETAVARIHVQGSMFMQVTKPGIREDADTVEYGGFIRKIYDHFPTPVFPEVRFPFAGLFDNRSFDALALLFGSRNFSQLTNR